MPRERKTPSANQNWIKQETVNEFKKSALKTLQKCKEFEEGRKFKYVKVSDTPRTFKRIEIKD